MPNSKIKMGATSIAARRLKGLREGKELSVQAMAIHSGLDPKHIKRIETYESDCSILILRRLLKGLEMDWNDFFNEVYLEIYIKCLEEEEVSNEN